tara:strand:- start:110 stop:283 length:174 start_codon:yes stop_codon:yes gene_type:complete
MDMASLRGGLEWELELELFLVRIFEEVEILISIKNGFWLMVDRLPLIQMVGLIMVCL